MAFCERAFGGCSRVNRTAASHTEDTGPDAVVSFPPSVELSGDPTGGGGDYACQDLLSEKEDWSTHGVGGHRGGGRFHIRVSSSVKSKTHKFGLPTGD